MGRRPKGQAIDPLVRGALGRGKVSSRTGKREWALMFAPIDRQTTAQKKKTVP